MEADRMSSTHNNLSLRGRPHVVLVPCPLQGHLTPMFHLAMTLHFNGFSITIILIRTHPDSPDPFSNYPAFSVEYVDGEFVDGETDDSEDVMRFLLAINRKLERPFREVLGRVASDRSRGRVSCIVQDSVMYLAIDAARGMEIPRLVLRTSSVTNFLGLVAVIDQKARRAEQEYHVDREELSSIRVKDLPVFDRGCSESAEQVLSKTREGTRTAVAIIWNTISCLEKISLDKVKASFSVPIFDVGPLHISTPGFPTSLLGDQERSCIEWLDSQIPNSVIYVSTGSLVTLTTSELTEMALGLALSGQPFLWVTRDGLLKRSEGHVDVAGLVGARGKRLMVGEESLEMKKRAMGLKDKVEGSLRFGGSSYRSRQDLLNFISSLQKYRE